MHDQTDLEKARDWLDQAAGWLTETNGYRDGGATLAHADTAALIGTGYAHVAAVEQWASARDEDIARWLKQREDARPNDEVVEESNRLGLERARRELALVEQRSDLLAALDLRDQRQREEARPHDDEPRGEAAHLLEGDDEVFTAVEPSCEFVQDGKRCVFGAGHQARWHELEDGAEVDGQTTEGADRG